MKILYEDNEIIVCQKEAGEPVQSSALRTKDMVSQLKTYLRERDPKAQPYLAPVHRLDQPVQGILVFAKTPKAANALTAQLTDGRMEKLYLARCDSPIEGADENWRDMLDAGWTDDGAELLTDYLLKDGRSNTSRVVSEGTKGAKKSQLLYKRLSGDLLWIHLLTGRHHQIRVQLAHAGMPLLGDKKYGKGTENVDNSLRFACLCAYQLTFAHPKTGKKMIFALQPEQIWFLSGGETCKMGEK